MQAVKKYSFVNNHSLLIGVEEINDYNEVLYDILYEINLILNVFIDNTISVSKLNIDHLRCVEYCIGQNGYMIVLNVIKFNVDRMVFVGQDGNVYDMHNRLNFMLDCVKGKLEKVLKGKREDVVKNVKRVEQSEPKIIKVSPEPKPKYEQLDSIVKSVDKSFDKSFDDEDTKGDELLKMMNELKDKRNKEIERLELLKANIDDKDKQLSKDANKLGDEKRVYQKNKEKEDENKNIFKADKKSYYMLKQDIEDGKVSENNMSILFKNKYPIFKFMECKGLLDNDDEYVQYVSIYNELYPKKDYDIEAYVPHNIHYLNEDEKIKYDNIKDKGDMLSDFIGGKNKIKPLEEVLRDIDNDGLGNDENDCGVFGDVRFDLD